MALGSNPPHLQSCVPVKATKALLTVPSWRHPSQNHDRGELKLNNLRAILPLGTLVIPYKKEKLSWYVTSACLCHHTHPTADRDDLAILVAIPARLSTKQYLAEIHAQVGLGERSPCGEKFCLRAYYGASRANAFPEQHSGAY